MLRFTDAEWAVVQSSVKRFDAPVNIGPYLKQIVMRVLHNDSVAGVRAG